MTLSKRIKYCEYMIKNIRAFSKVIPDIGIPTRRHGRIQSYKRVSVPKAIRYIKKQIKAAKDKE
jgi:hypothetical protein